MIKNNVIVKNKYRLALNNPDNKYDNDISTRIKDVNKMFNYISNPNKQPIKIVDYINDTYNIRAVNLVLENGDYATKKEVEQRKKDYQKYINNANLYKGIISFRNEFIDNNITLRELEKRIAVEVMPRFLKQCGFKEMNKMSYQIALHTDTDNYHFHYSFIEKCPNYINRNGKIQYRRKGKIDKKDLDYLKNQIVHSISKGTYYTNLLTKTNNDIKELKSYFSDNNLNFILQNKEDFLLEDKILKLGYLLKKYRKDNPARIKYNSINFNSKMGKEVKTLTSEIKKLLFNDKNSALYKMKKSFNADLKKLNNYFDNLNEENNITTDKSNLIYLYNKKKDLNNYVYNSIVNYAINKYNNQSDKAELQTEDLLHEIIISKNIGYENKSSKKKKKNLLKNYYRKRSNNFLFPNKYEVEQAFSNLKYEMDKSAEEFYKMFEKDNEYSNDDYEL